MIQKREESASLVKGGHSASNVTIKTYKCPLPHLATWGNTQNHDHKLLVLSKVTLEHISISVVAWIGIQHILPWCPDPFGWHRDKRSSANGWFRCIDNHTACILIPRVESITDESLDSNCSIIENIPPKGERFSDFIATFTKSVGFDTYFYLQH